MSRFVLDASYALTWFFPDRATADTDDRLRRMETHADSAIVPSVWPLKVGNALGKAVARCKLPIDRALEIWAELLLLPIPPQPDIDVAASLRLAVKHNLSVYDACYLLTAILHRLPLATNDRALDAAAAANDVGVIRP